MPIRVGEKSINKIFVGSSSVLRAYLNGVRVFGEPAGVIALGGLESVIQEGNTYYKIHTFNSSGTLEILQGGLIEYLVVAGGGGGGANAGGGGGAGGCLEGFSEIVTGSFNVTVGSGGLGGFSPLRTYNMDRRGNSGENSSIASIAEAVGGGYGGGSVQGNGSFDPGGAGGSGGGAGNIINASNGLPGGSGVSGQGNNGGSLFGAAGGNTGGGGGGRSVSGSNGVSGKAGDGGNGFSSSISGSTVYYAGGGGGGTQGTQTPGSGGLGGGGNGSNSQGGNAQNGAPNTGGGGGGSGGALNSQRGGAGGSGIVIVRYEVPKSVYDSFQ